MTCVISPTNLGNTRFKETYNLKYAYLAGSMYKGIASVELVVKLGKAGLMGYFGTGGLRLPQIEQSIHSIQRQLENRPQYGMNLLCNLVKPQLEEQIVDLFLKYGVRNIEAAAYMQLTHSLVWFRLKGLKRGTNGQIITCNKVLAKVSRPEVAKFFMSPAPKEIVTQLVNQGKLSSEEAECAQYVPIAHDICIEADSGGHTDRGVAYALMPAMQRLRREIQAKYSYTEDIRIGAAGGIGASEAIAAAFVLGADFIMTGSINQCTVEAGTSDIVKDLLQEINVQDTTYVPAGDMFELGAKAQVMRKGLLFPARANRLYELYKQYNSIDDIDEKTKVQIQNKYFKRDFEEVWKETKSYYLKEKPEEIEHAEKNCKHKMALIFRWYFIHTNRLAVKGIKEGIVDYQIHCGPAMGAFNQSVKGTNLEDWRNRHVDMIAERLMNGAADILSRCYQQWL